MRCDWHRFGLSCEKCDFVFVSAIMAELRSQKAIMKPDIAFDAAL